MTEPVWVDRQALILLQGETLAEHGGREGIREDGLLDSALARPVNLHAYEPQTDLARLAAAYVVGVTHNRSFLDGNKRVAFLALGLFLALNGKRLVADKVEATRIMLAAAAEEVGEEELAKWLRPRISPRS
jgi:death-on-curing protein